MVNAVYADNLGRTGGREIEHTEFPIEKKLLVCYHAARGEGICVPFYIRFPMRPVEAEDHEAVLRIAEGAFNFGRYHVLGSPQAVSGFTHLVIRRSGE